MQKDLQMMRLSLPVGNLSAYIAATKQDALLSLQEEQALAERWFYHQDIEAARQLVLSHLRFVVSIAKRYMGYGLGLADLIQEGNIGLMKAVKRFNPTLGVRLVSFAVHWVKAEIHEFILRNWRIVKIATTKAQRKLFFNLRRLKQHFSSNYQAIAEALDVNSKAVVDMDARLQASDTDLAAAYDIPASHGDPAQLVETHGVQESTQEKLFAALESLDERSKDILRKRWLNEDKATLQMLAENYQVSAERIRQLEKSAMQKLKKAIMVTA